MCVTLYMVVQYENYVQSNRICVVALACKLANTLAMMPYCQQYFLRIKYSSFYHLLLFCPVKKQMLKVTKWQFFLLDV